MKRLKKKNYYTTSEVANILNVAVGSVINWVDDGEIKAVVTPGGHRKIPYRDLVTFLESHHYDVPLELTAKKCICLVDDEVDMHEIFNHIIKTIKKFEAKGFFSGTEALLSMGQEPPSIIVVDILMPDFDGLQVIKHIKGTEKLKDVRIIAISGDTTKKDASITAGADVFLQKPFNIKDFKTALTEIGEELA